MSVCVSEGMIVRVSKRRMAKIMYETGCFNQVRINEKFLKRLFDPDFGSILDLGSSTLSPPPRSYHTGRAKLLLSRRRLTSKPKAARREARPTDQPINRPQGHMAR
jgi:hypothetical protein